MTPVRSIAAAAPPPPPLPAECLALTVDTIAWQEIAPDGTRYALLRGRRDRAGEPFVYAFFLPAGFWDPPHHHSADARIAVLSGELRFAWGDRFDPSRSEPLRMGDELVVPGGAVHFDGAEVDTLIVGTAIGPWVTRYADPAHRASAGTPTA